VVRLSDGSFVLVSIGRVGDRVGLRGFLGGRIFCWLPQEIFRERTCSWFGAGVVETSFSGAGRELGIEELFWG
jgi:hypothetical protein